MRKLQIFLIVIALGISIPPAKAIEGGQQVLGTQLVLPMMVDLGIGKDAFGNPSNKPSFRCSASLITSQIILTAAHCVAKPDTSDGSLYVPTTNLKLFPPGVDFNESNKAISVEKVVFTSGYANYWNPASRDARTQKDDIAFLFISKPLTPELADYKIEIANEEEVALMKQNGLIVKHYGYGFQKNGYGDGKPYTVDLVTYPLGSARYGNAAAENSKTISTNETGVKAICPGDSGSPWYSEFNGKLKLVANTVGGSGCGNGSINGTLGTLIYPYLDLMNKEWVIFKASITIQTPTISPTPTPYKKTGVNITCVKGKTIKKFLSTNGKCPSGYKKR
jgi:secreted trypsin-like serine protease